MEVGIGGVFRVLDGVRFDFYFVVVLVFGWFRGGGSVIVGGFRGSLGDIVGREFSFLGFGG